MKRLLQLLFALAISAEAASPQISGVKPLAVVPGKKTVLTLTGSNLDPVSNLWTSFGPVGRRITNAVFEVFCEEDKHGVGAIQAYSPDGVSEFRLVLIDTLPATNRIGAETAVDAAFASEKVDSYSFNGKAGEELSIEVLAHRIGSQADPVLRVLDLQGREVAFSDDEDGVWRDARLQFKPPITGEYTLAVHDIGYGGGSQYFYRLRVGHFPIVSVSYPLRDWTDRGTREPAAPNAPQSPANPEASVWYAEIPMLMERESKDAQEFGLPVVINGRFECSDDRDLYRFSAAEGERLVFFAQSRSLGSPCDVLLRVRIPSGDLIAENDVKSADELPLTHTFAKAGTYLLEARELTGEAPANAPYRIKVSKWLPTFTVSTEVNKLEIAPGESAKMKITCERAGYDGEIALESESVLLENNVIAAKAKEAEVTVKLKDGAQSLAHFTIEAKGTNGVTKIVSTRPALKKTFPLMLNLPPHLDGLIAVDLKKK